VYKPEFSLTYNARRVCPGRYLAENTLFMMFTTMLATCDILPPLDENGKEVMPGLDYTSGMFT
jgi:hypothetical protein